MKENECGGGGTDGVHLGLGQTLIFRTDNRSMSLIRKHGVVTGVTACLSTAPNPIDMSWRVDNCNQDGVGGRRGYGFSRK